MNGIQLPPLTEAQLEQQAIDEAIDAAFKEAVREGYFVKTGEVRWCEKTDRFEPVYTRTDKPAAPESPRRVTPPTS
ncbi:MAG: hypothetical protein ABSA68_02530 [Xanthobacteraceae bacterium]|jgi:murein tripeptide amidase MpaA